MIDHVFISLSPAYLFPRLTPSSLILLLEVTSTLPPTHPLTHHSITSHQHAHSLTDLFTHSPTRLQDTLPYNDYFEYFGPDYKLHLPVS